MLDMTFVLESLRRRWWVAGRMLGMEDTNSLRYP